MKKTKILLLAFFLGLSVFLISSQPASAAYEYIIKNIMSAARTICCENTNIASCLSNIGPITPKNIDNYFEPFYASAEEEYLAKKEQGNTNLSYQAAEYLCLVQNNCTEGQCLAGTKANPPNQCSLQTPCPLNSYCEANILPNICVAKYQSGHDCLSSYECQSGSCLKYDYVCATPCTTTCPTGQYCDGGACQLKKTTGQLCKIDKECVSKFCYFGQCAEPAYCKIDADCADKYYCDNTEKPFICLEKKLSMESCAKDNQCLSGKCSYNKCVTANDQCKSDLNCPSSKYCNIFGSPKTCVTKKAAGVVCSTSTANQCLSGQCVSSECTAVDECQKDSHCQTEQYCDMAVSPKTCQDQKALNAGCTTNNECLSGYCLGSQCSIPTGTEIKCSTDNDCLKTDYYSYCDKTSTIFECKSKKSEGTSCQTNGECTSGTCSSAGQCVKSSGCAADEDCPSDKKCNLASHLCEEATPEVCEMAGGLIKIKCTVDQYCSWGTCVNKKGVSEECEIGGHCQSGFCHPEEKECQAVPQCGNQIVEYDEECEINDDPGTGSAYTQTNCVNCQVISEQVIGCKADKDCGNKGDYYCDAAEVKCKQKLSTSAYCTADNQCLSGYCDTTGVSTGTGSAGCAPKPKEAAAGSAAGQIACDNKGECKAGYYCDDQKICQPQKLANEKCSDNKECAYGVCPAPANVCGCKVDSACNYGEYCKQDTFLCEKLSVASGQACNPDAVNQCPAHEYCNATNKTCALKKSAGNVCAADAECLSKICDDNQKICGCLSHNECQTGFFCNLDVKSEGASSNLCVAKYNTGESCIVGEDFVCQSGKCTDDKCAAPTGEAAGGTQIKSIELPNFLGTDDIAVVIGRVINFILGLIGSAAFAMFIYGGVLWLISRGEAEYIKKGRETMIWAAIGLIIIFASFVIIKFILRVIGSTAGQ